MEFAFQPIVNVHTGEAYGFEALLRGFERLGFGSIAQLFESLEDVELAAHAEVRLQEKAVASFLHFARDYSARLFFNLNTRVLESRAYSLDETRAILAHHGLRIPRFCLELSEAQAINFSRAQELVDRGAERPLIALDDFGTGYSGLRLLSESTPDIIKVDRFFVSEIDAIQTKRLFLTQIVSLAHSTGLAVVAEGIETENEFRICREIGCDFVQGFFVGRPSTDLTVHRAHYPIVEEVNRRNRRMRLDVSADIRAQLDRVPALPVDAPMVELLDAFRREEQRSFFPIVDGNGAPLGIVHEAQIKKMIYAPYGRDLLMNRARPPQVRDYITPCVVFDANTVISRILSAIAVRPQDHAVLLVENGKYIGLLDTRGIIRTMHDHLVTMARDQNPLTRLPGNTMVADFLARALEEARRPVAFIYFDFDHFKPFNDQFGFRQGDRAITIFADLMRTRLAGADVFLGHIGGDDFFAGVSGPSTPAVLAQIPALLAQFSTDVESFYDPEARRAGVTDAHDREGVLRSIPLLSVSCAALVIDAGAMVTTMDAVSATLARLKRASKRDAGRYVIEHLTAQAPVEV